MSQPIVYPPPAEVRDSFRQMLDRPRVSPDQRLHESRLEPGGLLTESLSFASEKRPDGSIERVPILIVRPATGIAKRPAVIVLHGTGGTKEAMKPVLLELAKRGFVGVAIDARYHGERTKLKVGSQAYNEAIARAWTTKSNRHEHPFYYDTCWDLWRTVDYLVTRFEVDPKKIGMIGFSMGGIQTWLAASVDERVAVAVPAIAVQSFRWSLDNDRWQARANTIRLAHETAARDLGEPKVNARVCRELWTKVVPGILDRYDCPSMLRLFAGRPLLILSGENDPNCPLEGAKTAFAEAERAYRAANCLDKLKIDVAANTGHRVTDGQRQMAFDWFERWLK